MSGGIITGPEIISAIHREDIYITPFEPGLVNPASVDLRLGDEVSIYEDWVDCSAADHHKFVDEAYEVTHFDGNGLVGGGYMSFVQDIKKPARTREFKMNEEVGWVLKPGILYLMHTEERICTTKYVPVLDGKSSIGRLGIQVHITAGYGDPGFDGQYTLEVVVTHPVRVYPGMRFCQMRFHTMVGAFQDYQKTGHYKGKAAKGAVGSAAYKQFQENA